MLRNFVTLSGNVALFLSFLHSPLDIIPTSAIKGDFLFPLMLQSKTCFHTSMHTWPPYKMAAVLSPVCAYHIIQIWNQ